MLRSIDLAIADIRRGGAVAIDSGPGQSAVMLAAETASDRALTQLSELSGTDLGIVMPRQRAAALGLSEDGVGPVLLAPREGLDIDTVRMAADPTAITLAEFRAWREISATGSETAEAAALGLIKLARLLPVAVMSGLDTDMAPDAAEWAMARGLRWVRATQVDDYAEAAARAMTAVAEARVPLLDAIDARVIAFRPGGGEVEHLAIVVGKPSVDAPPLVRIHSACFTGDVLGSLRCDCGDQLRGALQVMRDSGGGAILYLAQEGRGIGLVNKLRAYALQDQGVDTFDANELLGFGADDRLYLPAAEMLRHLGIASVRLLTNNPEKAAALEACGIPVAERVPHAIPANGHNDFYLLTKARRQGHTLD